MDTSFVSNSVQERDFNQSVISIGSHADNDIVLSGEGILPFHATVLLEDEKYRIIPAEVGAQIWIDGSALQDAYALFGGSEQIEIGTYALFFQKNETAESVHVIIYAGIDEEAPEAFLEDDTAEAILINMISGEADIEVEQSAFFEFEVVNAGPIVARFTVSLRGVPKDWVEVTPSVMNLNEGRRQLVRVTITPPRSPESEAGTHTLQVVVSSPNYGRQRAIESLMLTIQPFYEFTLGNLSPRTQRIHWRKKKGVTYLPIKNRSNTSADFNLMAMDDEGGCSFDFLLDENLELNRQASFKLEPFETIELPIRITPIKNPMFSLRSKLFHYTTNVQIPQQITTPQTVSGSVKRVPLFGWWSIMMGVATLLLALFFILQPNIRSFDVEAGKDVIEQGDTTKLAWEVSPFATRLSLSNLEQPINRGQVSQTVAPEQSTTYELTSGNWLSGMFGMDQTQAVTVLVVPPTPQVNVFEVDRTEISKGQMVRVRWSVSEAEEVLLTIDEVVYPLSEEEYSGEREVLLEKDALVTLEAKNASGSELQSYFVNVEPPYININTFAVWVRADSAAANSNGAEMVATSSGGKLFSPTNAPDPNFPVKFVEMVPEPDSETGYRVQFNTDAREELSKGEQVMVEWDIDGSDTLTVNPLSEDPLPARGTQPFFPQESMNFIMTATSGDLESIFMLPVKVFDGVPPEAPTIDFFQASPTKLVGEGNVQFSWSVSGEWTRVQIAGADGVLADYLNPVGFQDLTIEESSTIILTAYNGELSTSQPIDIEVNPALESVGLYFASAYPATGRFLINEAVAFTIDFYDIDKSDPATGTYVDPEIAPTGEVLVTDGVSLCKITLPAKTCDLTFTTPDDPKEITASYEGDDVYLSATSKPYDQYISVISSTVTLTPTYYVLDRDDPDNSPTTTPISINNVSIDSGIFVRVKVTPQGAPLPSPDIGNVNLYLCDQVGSEIVAGSCNPYGFASIALSGSAGIADIVIENFPEAGLHALLLSYSATGFEPAEWVEYDVNVGKIEIELRMDSCSNPQTFTGCEIGTSDPSSAQAVFQIWRSDTTIPERLLSSLVSPVLDAFDIYEIVSSNIENWDCEMGVEIDSGKNYRILDCTADFSGPPVRSSTTVNVEFDESKDDNYLFKDPDNFNFGLTVKSNTLVSLKAADFQNLKVGQVVNLTNASGTGGAVNLTDSSFTPITPGGAITVTSNKNGTFAIGASPAGCSVNGNGNIVTIPDITTDCPIYFQTVTAVDDPFSLTVAYAGDATHYQSQSSNPLAVNIAKQDEVTLKWYQKDTSYVVWYKNSMPKDTRMDIRIELGDLGVFSEHAFTGDGLRITLDEPTCSMISGATAGGYPNYYVPITQTGIGGSPPRVDFAIQCTTTNRTVHITAALLNTSDFSIKAGETTQQTVGILDRNSSYLNISFIRDSDSTSMLTGSIGPLHFGEKYTLQITTGRIWADSDATYTTRIDKINNILLAGQKVQVTFPASIYSKIDWSKSTCADLGSNKVGVSLNAYNVVYDFGNPNLYTSGITDIELYNSTPCILYFDTTYTAGSGNTSFSFTPVGTPCCNSSRSGISSTLDKQTVTISAVPSSYNAYVDSPSATMTLTVTPEIAATTLDPLNSSTFSTLFTSPIVSSCGTPAGAMNSGVPTLTLTHPSIPAAACTGDITVAYLGNNWFKATTKTIASEVRKHNPNMSILYKNNGGNYVAFDAPYPQIDEGDTLEMQIRVRKGADGFASTPTPSATITVWMVDSGDNILDPEATTPIYSIDDTPSGVSYNATTKKYTVTLNGSSNALFAINVEGAGTNLVLKYDYSGDGYYFSESDETGYLEFKALPAP